MFVHSLICLFVISFHSPFSFFSSIFFQFFFLVVSVCSISLFLGFGAIKLWRGVWGLGVFIWEWKGGWFGEKGGGGGVKEAGLGKLRR